MKEYWDDKPDFTEIFRGSRARKKPKQKPEKPAKLEKPLPTIGFFLKETIAAMRANSEMQSGKRRRRKRRTW
jgi:hypothetical protein